MVQIKADIADMETLLPQMSSKITFIVLI